MNGLVGGPLLAVSLGLGIPGPLPINPALRSAQLTQYPEHEADLDARHEDVFGPERRLEHVVDFAVVLRVRLAKLEHLGRVVRYRVRLLVESERGGRQQDQEAEVR